MGSHVNIPSEILLEGSAAVDNLVEDGGQSTREQIESKELLESAKIIANNECAFTFCLIRLKAMNYK